MFTLKYDPKPDSGLASLLQVSFLGDAESSLGDAESSLGDAKSSLGDVKSLMRNVRVASSCGKSCWEALYYMGCCNKERLGVSSSAFWVRFGLQQ